MHIQEMVKNAIISNRKEIELSQQAMISGVSSLIYSEYLHRIIQKDVPVKRILVPTIRSVREVLDQHGPFMSMMSEHFIDSICSHDLFRKYAEAPEFKIFDKENVEVFKTIFDLYISPNISRTIPDVISRKFCLMDDNQQMFIENREADLFDRHPINDEQFKFIIEETILHMLATIPSVIKDIEFPENKNLIPMDASKVMGINHENAICPIYINIDIVQNESVIGLIEFVTSTQVMMTFKPSTYRVSTNQSNEVSVMTFHDIKK